MTMRNFSSWNFSWDISSNPESLVAFLIAVTVLISIV